MTRLTTEERQAHRWRYDSHFLFTVTIPAHDSATLDMGAEYGTERITGFIMVDQDGIAGGYQGRGSRLQALIRS